MLIIGATDNGRPFFGVYPYTIRPAAGRPLPRPDKN